MEEVGDVLNKTVGFYNEGISSLPVWFQTIVPLIFLVFVVFLFAVFIWHFYRFFARKNVVGINLVEYNPFEHSLTSSLFASFLYLLENIIISPFIILVGFSVFTIFLLFVNETLTIQGILIVSAMIIAVIRISAYYRENLARELSKLLPISFLAISLSNPKSFLNFETLLLNLSKIPLFFDKILVYLTFIVIIEIIMRFFYYLFGLFGLEEVESAEQEAEKQEAVEEGENLQE